VHIAPELNFKHHILTIESKLAKALFALRMSKNFLNENSRKLVYYALFQSHLIYAIQIWSCTAKNNLKNIERMQKEAIRLVCGKKRYEHTEPLFKKMEIFKLDDLIFIFNCQFMYQYTRKKTPLALEGTWEEERQNDRLRRRNGQMAIRIPFSRLATTDKLPLINLPRLWMQLEENIRVTVSVLNFNKLLKEKILNSYSNNVVCNRLLCPSCMNIV
jgi:hypothetical protein